MFKIDQSRTSHRDTLQLMTMQRLHLCAYPCEKCSGPVVAASLGVRESEIKKEAITFVGAACLSCGNKQDVQTLPLRRFFPTAWDISNKDAGELDVHTTIADQSAASVQDALPGQRRA